jgi:hypothetical protein
MASNPHPNLAGFSIWAYDYWTDTDFTAWANWATKGSVPSPALTSLEATFVTAVIITIVVATAALLLRKNSRKITAKPREAVASQRRACLFTCLQNYQSGCEGRFQV